MAAVIVTPDHLEPIRRPARPSSRPSLELLPGGRRGARTTARSRRPAARVQAGTYRRRRLGAALALVTALAVGYLAVTGLMTVVDGRADAPASAGVAAGATAASPSYVVQPGDTLWSIARRLRPHGDVRPLVDQLESRAGGAALVPGQRLRLDGLAD
jgi:hypothetical protein